MIPRTLYICILLFFVFTRLTGQIKHTYDFDKQNEAWNASDNILQISSDKAASGENSLRYKPSEKATFAQKALFSIDTKHTITKIRIAKSNGKKLIIAGSYNGVIMGIGFDGVIRWKTNVSNGITIYDIWCDDLDANQTDEVIVASANGGTYCLEFDGTIRWEFKPNEAPMISACAIHKSDGTAFVACGGNDWNIYYISASGQLLSTVPSSRYETIIKPNKKWLDDGYLTYNVHTVNFLRPIPQADGTDVLALNAIVSNGDQQSVMHYFKPMETLPYRSYKIGYGHGPIGDMRLIDFNNDGNYTFLLGSSGARNTTNLTVYNPTTDSLMKMDQSLFSKTDQGYKVAQTVVIKDNNASKYLVKFGSNLLIAPEDLNKDKTETLSNALSYNDMWEDDGIVFLASSQSGGSCIHLINTRKEGWKTEYKKLLPPGNIQTILDNTATLKENLKSFQRPAHEREPITTYMMSPPSEPANLINDIKNNYNSPKFLGYKWTSDYEDWDRSVIGNESFENARDSRKSYTRTQQELLDLMIPAYNDVGLCTWGGHGTDPFYYNPETIFKIIDAGEGRKNVWIWPELTILYKDEFDVAINKLFYPFAEYGKDKNAMLFMRVKHTFWLSKIYTPMWSRFLSGEFADLVVPSMEETQDMSMDLSLAGRLGLWASGAMNQWGTRCARDNPSTTRNRQFCHQELPNHFLRNAVFHAAYGASYINNYNIGGKYSDYMSILWNLIAKGALYIPKREEIISFNPVHLSMLNPDKRYERESNSGTTTIRFEKDYHPQNPYVFSRINGSWAGAEVAEHDFSSYAAGVKDRRVNFLAPYPNGMVLITPPQEGKFADTNAPRGKMIDKLHPVYKNIMEEYYTDGHYYYAKDSSEVYAADSYYKTIESDIKEAAKKLPITVSGEKIAWVVAQTSPRHLRLTLIDGGYLDPANRKAKVTFHTVLPVAIKDVVDKKTFNTDGSEITIDIPCGLFRFLDIELSEPL